ncbi:hypothetical protein IP92_05775 [Pseudoduganella flava]|uniref:Uncharacterized protein n=1 Tax=Pseudoduganella flava TaxID=871742 RepID=A0A562P9C2_9BURK|nr:hypothetical protein [Pseudoduganella flava]QGZ42695.1 hypothetical protein GO485_29120 [Pseudoduganella flava]TWI41054.1 hypothetical protein IP92_05775 [Pseudoduganella flava]
MKTMSPVIAAAVLAALEAEEARTEIIRVRVGPKTKSAFTKYSASLGLPAATNAYRLLMDKMQAHVSHPPAMRTGASRRPVARAMNNRRLL